MSLPLGWRSWLGKTQQTRTSHNFTATPTSLSEVFGEMILDARDSPPIPCESVSRNAVPSCSRRDRQALLAGVLARAGVLEARVFEHRKNPSDSHNRYRSSFETHNLTLPIRMLLFPCRNSVFRRRVVAAGEARLAILARLAACELASLNIVRIRRNRDKTVATLLIHANRPRRFQCCLFREIFPRSGDAMRPRCSLGCEVVRVARSPWSLRTRVNPPGSQIICRRYLKVDISMRPIRLMRTP